MTGEQVVCEHGYVMCTTELVLTPESLVTYS